MQEFGLANDYGCFQLATVIGTVGLFEVYGNSFDALLILKVIDMLVILLTLPLNPCNYGGA